MKLSINYQTLVLACCGMMLSVTACKKTPQDTTTAPTPTPTVTNTVTNTPLPTEKVYNKTGLNTLFAQFRSTPQNLTVIAGTDQTVYGAKGTKLTFYSNSFKDASGNTITSGTINLSLVEMYSPGSMIANRATTSATAGILKSGGQIYLTATQSGATVYARKYGIGFAQPAASSTPMALYFGNTANADSVTTWGAAGTTTGTTSTGTTNDTSGGTGGGGYNNRYQFDSCTDFHWINCDHFMGSGTLGSVGIVIPDSSFNPGNMQVFMIFPSDRSVMSSSGYSSISKKASFMNVPVGMTVTLVIMANKGGNFYYYEQSSITIANGLTLNATPVAQTLSYIQGRLTSL